MYGKTLKNQKHKIKILYTVKHNQIEDFELGNLDFYNK